MLCPCRRYLKVCEGELLYYKPEEREVWQVNFYSFDIYCVVHVHVHMCTMYMHIYMYMSLQQALNIIPLKANVTSVEKLGTRGFVVSLAHSKKTFRYM